MDNYIYIILGIIILLIVINVVLTYQNRPPNVVGLTIHAYKLYKILTTHSLLGGTCTCTTRGGCVSNSSNNQISLKSSPTTTTDTENLINITLPARKTHMVGWDVRKGARVRYSVQPGAGMKVGVSVEFHVSRNGSSGAGGNVEDELEDDCGSLGSDETIVQEIQSVKRTEVLLEGEFLAPEDGRFVKVLDNSQLSLLILLFCFLCLVLLYPFFDATYITKNPIPQHTTQHHITTIVHGFDPLVLACLSTLRLMRRMAGRSRMQRLQRPRGSLTEWRLRSSVFDVLKSIRSLSPLPRIPSAFRSMFRGQFEPIVIYL